PAPGVLDDRLPLQFGNDFLGLTAENLPAQLVADLFLHALIERLLPGVLTLYQPDDVEAIAHLHDGAYLSFRHPEQVRFKLQRLDLAVLAADAGPVAECAVTIVVRLAQGDEVSPVSCLGGDFFRQFSGRFSVAVRGARRVRPDADVLPLDRVVDLE